MDEVEFYGLNDSLTHGIELVIRRFKLVTREVELVTRGFEVVYLKSKLIKLNS